MKQIFNHTFFRFFLGFLAIILVSFAITGYVAQTSEEDIDPTSQTACQTEDC